MPRLGQIAHRRPLRGPRVAARRLERFARVLPVMGQQGGLRREVVRVELPDRARDGGVYGGASLAELGPVRHVAGQRVLEGVLRHRVERLLVDELGRLEGRQRFGDLPARQSRHGLENRLRELLPHDRTRLEHLLLALRKSIDARCQERLDGARDLQLVDRRGQPVAPLGALEVPGLDQRPDDLLGEERVPRRARVDAIGQACDAGIAAE